MLSLSKFYNISIKPSSLCKILPFADKQMWPIAMLRVPLLVGIHHYTRMTGVSGIAPITKVTWTPVHPNIIMQSKPYLIFKGHKYHSFFLLSTIGHNDLFIVIKAYFSWWGFCGQTIALPMNECSEVSCCTAYKPSVKTYANSNQAYLYYRTAVILTIRRTVK